jgi:hypothetical protein
MKSVRIYYAGIPAKNNKSEKRDVLRNFHLGIPDGQSTEVETFDYRSSDLAVIQGWVHANSGNAPHLAFRKKIIEQQKQLNKKTLAIDSNLFLYRDPGNTKQYLRFSLDDVFPTTGEYFRQSVTPRRWQQIKQDLGIDLQPWREDGDHILVCLQRNGGWSMGNVDVMKWCHDTVKDIRKKTDRPIVIRTHPGDKRAAHYIRFAPKGVRISKAASILEDFKNCWACVTYNSSPGVAAAIEGVPVFVTDKISKRSQAYEVANLSLTDINQPLTFDRQDWIEKISMSHFNFADLRSGAAWSIIKDYL